MFKYLIAYYISVADTLSMFVKEMCNSVILQIQFFLLVEQI